MSSELVLCPRDFATVLAACCGCAGGVRAPPESWVTGVARFVGRDAGTAASFDGAALAAAAVGGGSVRSGFVIVTSGMSSVVRDIRTPGAADRPDLDAATTGIDGRYFLDSAAAAASISD